MKPCAACGGALIHAAILVTEAWCAPDDGLRSMQTTLCSHRCLLTWTARLIGDLDDFAMLERMAALPPREDWT